MPTTLTLKNILDDVYEALKSATAANRVVSTMQRANCSEPTRNPPRPLWRSEFRNLLTGYLCRRAISLSQACELMRQAEAVVADSVALDSNTVLELVSASRCTAYDCKSSALALDLELPLVTAERKVLDASPRIAMPLPD